jgi:hypothetical protein
MAIAMIWVSFPVSVFRVVQAGWLKVLLLSIAAGVTLYLYRLPTVPPVENTSDNHKG